MTTTTGRRAATEPLRLISAVRTETSSIVRTSSRTRLSPACRIRNWPVQAVTPVASRPALTTNSEAMNTTAGSPNPASAWPRSSTPVAHSASAVAIATTTTGKRSQTNSTTITATIAKVRVMSLNSVAPVARSRCSLACARAPDRNHLSATSCSGADKMIASGIPMVG